jgi:CBS domain-containing protein
MSLAKLCQRHVVTIHADASLRDAALAMRDHHVGALVVTQLAASREQVVGLITDRDLIVDGMARDRDHRQTQVGQLASVPVQAVPLSASVPEAIERMREAGVRRLLVSDTEGQLIGLISADDLWDSLAAQASGLASAQRHGLEREAAAPAKAAAPRPVFLAHGTPGMQQPVRAK